MLLFNALLALAELTAAFSGRPIMLKHKTLYVSPKSLIENPVSPPKCVTLISPLLHTVMADAVL